MAYRDMKQTAQKAEQAFSEIKRLEHYDIDLDELTELVQLCMEGKHFDALCLIFNYGFALGTRAKSKNIVSTL